MSREKSMAALGELATVFAEIEHRLGELLDRMVGGHYLTRPFLIDDLPLAKKITKCKKAAEHYFVDSHENQEQVKTLLSQIDKQREVRNLFIHGLWEVDEAGTARITTHRLRQNRTNKKCDDWHWTYLDTKSFVNRDIVEKLTTTRSLRSQVCSLVESLPPRW